jgi:integrase
VVALDRLEDGRDSGGVPLGPVADVDRQPVLASGDFDVLQPAEVLALARAAENEQHAALYITAAFTGLRMGELRALEWQDVDFGKALIHVRRNFTARGGYSLPKSGKVRSVPMVDHVMKALDGLSRREHFTAPDELVFVNVVGGTVDESKTRKRFIATLKRAKLQTIRFHDLRHTFGTLAVQIWPLTDVQGYLGHSDIGTTMRYVHHKPKHDAAQKLSALIDAEAGNLPENLPTSPDSTPDNAI